MVHDQLERKEIDGDKLSDTKCPGVADHALCEAPMELMSTETTLLGFVSDVDLNRRGELWQCPKCGGFFERGFKWSRHKGYG